MRRSQARIVDPRRKRRGPSPMQRRRYFQALAKVYDAAHPRAKRKAGK